MPKKLTTKQFKAAQMVAMGEMPAVIEEALNMRRHTLTRWRRLTAFQDAVRQHAREMQAALQQRILYMKYLSTSHECSETERHFSLTSSIYFDEKAKQQGKILRESSDLLSKMDASIDPAGAIEPQESKGKNDLQSMFKSFESWLK